LLSLLAEFLNQPAPAALKISQRNNPQLSQPAHTQLIGVAHIGSQVSHSEKTPAKIKVKIA